MAVCDHSVLTGVTYTEDYHYESDSPPKAWKRMNPEVDIRMHRELWYYVEVTWIMHKRLA